VREQNSTINSTIIGHRQSLQPYWQKSSKHYRKIHTSVQLNKPIETLDTETSVSDGVPEYRQAYAYTDRWQNAWCVPALHTATTDSAVGEAKPETHWCSKQDASSYTHIINWQINYPKITVWVVTIQNISTIPLHEYLSQCIHGAARILQPRLSTCSPAFLVWQLYDREISRPSPENWTQSINRQSDN